MDVEEGKVMARNLRFELKRAFINVNFVVSILIGMLICFADIVLFISSYGITTEHILIQGWIGTNFQFFGNSLYYILLPVIACLPYAGSYFEDMQSGYEKNICVKTSKRYYLMAKNLAVALSGFVSVSLPLALDLFIMAGLYPNWKPEKLTLLCAGIIDINLFAELFNTHPALYALVFILLAGLLGSLLGLMSLAVSRWCRSFFTVTVFPFVIYIILSVVFVSETGENIMSIMEMVNPLQRYITTYGKLFGGMAGIYIVFLLLRILANYRRDIL